MDDDYFLEYTIDNNRQRQLCDNVIRNEINDKQMHSTSMEGEIMFCLLYHNLFLFFCIQKNFNFYRLKWQHRYKSGQPNLWHFLLKNNKNTNKRVQNRKFMV